ncbi:hypothetical protein CVT26_010228 [Gymnopilus dilepis]|uniref:Uncharacterized protein n=1 Tax=Gymnopilus dilepis TaxID=231916 RepID=A0A409Y1B7_9AGAR|nr:hypothetical protein CVT26_010228 [Gymnopilus dilepis]
MPATVARQPTHPAVSHQEFEDGHSIASYTPVIFPEDINLANKPAFDSSLPSLSSLSSYTPPARTYLEHLQRKHFALAQIVREEPASPIRFASPSDDEDADPGTREKRIEDRQATLLAEREARITALRAQVHQALIKAEGNPADGKWAFLGALLRLQSTSGYSPAPAPTSTRPNATATARWVGTRTDKPAPKPLEGMGWINAQTDVEWREWEKRYTEERRVKEKVESWKRRVEPPSKGPSLAMEGVEGTGEVADEEGSVAAGPSQVQRRAAAAAATSVPQGKAKVTVTAAGARASTSQVDTSDPLRDAAPFGFGVVKRASQQNAISSAGGKPSKYFPTAGLAAAASKGKRAAGAGDPGPQPQGDDEAEDTPMKIGPPSSKKKKQDGAAAQRIADLPDTSFLPSFSSSQLVTSTPKRNAQAPSRSIPYDKSINNNALLQPQGNHIPNPLFLPSPSPSTPPPRPTVASHTAAVATSSVPGLGPSPSSPRVTKTYGRQSTTPRARLDTSASLPVLPIPSTPTRKRPAPPSANVEDVVDSSAVQDGAKNANNKRPLSPSTPKPPRGTVATGTPNHQLREEEEDVERALKRARTLSTFEEFSSPGLGRSPSRNRTVHQQTLTGFVEARRELQQELGSSRTPRAEGPTRPVGLKTPVPTPAVASSGTGQAPREPRTPAVPALPPPPPASLAPATPQLKGKKAALPTLTELLASAKKRKGSGAGSAVSSGSSKVAKAASSSSRGHGGSEGAGGKRSGAMKGVVEESEERREVIEELVPASAAGVGGSSGAVDSAHAAMAVDVSVLVTTGAGAAGAVELQAQAEVEAEPEPQSGSHSNSYPNAPAYAYPIDHLAPALHHPLDHNQRNLDPHADIPEDPYADHQEQERELDQELEHESIFGAAGGDYDPFADVDIDLASPAKSLSSIAGSDDEDEEDEVDQLAGDGDVLGAGFEFNPFATSTQQGPFGQRTRSPARVPGLGEDARDPIQDADADVPGVSQGSKDSWASVYVPSAAKSSSGAPASSTSHKALHPRSRMGSSHSHLSSNPFAPPAHPPSSNPLMFSYNSQQLGERVAKGVESANRLLNDDLDYEGWLNLKEGEEEEGQGGVEESP